jgi:hypothetical protein
LQKIEEPAPIIASAGFLTPDLHPRPDLKIPVDRAGKK